MNSEEARGPEPEGAGPGPRPGRAGKTGKGEGSGKGDAAAGKAEEAAGKAGKAAEAAEAEASGKGDASGKAPAPDKALAPDKSPAPGKNGSPARPKNPPKGEQTRALIIETALRLFRERGYDKTTMRAIAQEAGVSVGNAYYYFGGKEHLIQGFYDRIVAEHAVVVRPVLDKERDFEKRFLGVLRAWLEVAAPYHEFASQFFKNAADPESPLSPFSPESESARGVSLGIHREVLAGSRAKVSPELADAVPELMWLAQMGLVLYWVFDRSEGNEKTYRLAERGARLTAHGVRLSRFRLLRPLVNEVHDLFKDFLPGMAETVARRAASRDTSD
ncbi:TetR family transcriptional regulator [Streptomyces sp. AM 3-1-1]|uniref:TetR/AcrR family transcriptional regulator n=1 Tax=Streptomyces sp. AM 3-1-1 TaxID=3028711 RepID=UPI0023B88696|nr:TetR family transcriptional regulator [Streptomyces sp. AM 3-1-1]WEH31610.1 TetR family transcriptional regulator [Streptomyces sp. AM 3-1-1]